ncbi:enoyl-CoA hydratase/isomerase family protein [Pedobacter sp. SYP-B3415]|uniref:enoyl-CoA hydratase/isomerase family protein n=1 Tax=Pedobacter sp. SYP-B3415 TaxID=2496641 RepID=UPI00101D8D47|nr:enoyl-CoA hydratase-related protein [Pedobacter sp. SYP-B3415]
MAYQNLLIETDNLVQVITINREAKLNALNRETLAELSSAITAAAEDKGVRGIILTGAGPKAFVAGADIAEFASYSAAEGEELARTGQETVFNKIEHCPKPVLAAINGFALGGGLELALACHIRIASKQAKLGLPEVALGLIPGYGGTQRLSSLISKGKAFELIATADMLPAEDALQWGLINHVTEAEGLLAKAREIMAKITSRAPLAISAAIQAVNKAGTPEGFETEIAGFGACFGTADFKEGTKAFLEKRKPEFKGE